jgi:hypothetical protein
MLMVTHSSLPIENDRPKTMFIERMMMRQRCGARESGEVVFDIHILCRPNMVSLSISEIDGYAPLVDSGSFSTTVAGSFKRWQGFASRVDVSSRQTH